MEGHFDLKLILEYDGSGTQLVVKWLEKLELMCKLRKVDDIASTIPLRLTGGAFAVYLQLVEEDRKSTEKVKAVLLVTFAVDPYMAYEQFIGRKLHLGESPDVYLAELQRLASLFGGMSDKALACAFVAGLLESICQLLRAGSCMEALDLDQILSWARAVIREDSPLESPKVCFGATMHSAAMPGVLGSSQRCFACNSPNHIAIDCEWWYSAKWWQPFPAMRKVLPVRCCEPHCLCTSGKRAWRGGVSASLLSRWSVSKALPSAVNKVEVYSVPHEVREAYEEELGKWIEDG
ncbi:hypothetical protein O3P69_016461 [Scylla paramamosain]|uniref:CCHC-type domain-containing protein n=1 Tax=Scylla paramamosain TaxID=85552 RepID=A0AAW0TDP9_SCYPA